MAESVALVDMEYVATAAELGRDTAPGADEPVDAADAGLLTVPDAGRAPLVPPAFDDDEPWEALPEL